MHKKEVWKNVVGYNGLYQVSNFGRVRRSSPGPRTYIGKILRPATSKKGYHNVHLHKNKKGKSFKVSRLVAQAFIPNPANKPQVNHKNGIKNDDRSCNLEWVTNKENCIHRGKVLGLNKGELNPNAKLKEKEVVKIKKMLKAGKCLIKDIAKIYNVDETTISNINTGKLWAFLKI